MRSPTCGRRLSHRSLCRERRRAAGTRCRGVRITRSKRAPSVSRGTRSLRIHAWLSARLDPPRVPRSIRCVAAGRVVKGCSSERHQSGYVRMDSKSVCCLRGLNQVEKAPMTRTLRSVPRREPRHDVIHLTHLELRALCCDMARRGRGDHAIAKATGLDVNGVRREIGHDA